MNKSQKLIKVSRCYIGGTDSHQLEHDIVYIEPPNTEEYLEEMIWPLEVCYHLVNCLKSLIYYKAFIWFSSVYLSGMGNQIGPRGG